MKRKIRKELLDELLAGYENPEDLTGPAGLLKQLTGALVERALGAELTDHLGHEPGAATVSDNARNGTSPKTLTSDQGDVPIDQTAEQWRTALGWPIYRPLPAEDAHIFTVLRIPLSNSPSEFDEQIILLAKLMVDYLNEAELASALPGGMKGVKGIAKLEGFLKSTSAEGAAEVISFLRDLQTLRSTGSAHANGTCQRL